jgi:hypothetical protein
MRRGSQILLLSGAILFVPGARQAAAGSSQVVADLRGRALAALGSLQHPDDVRQAKATRAAWISRLAAALGGGRSYSGRTVSGLLYVPPAASDRAPAIMIVQPHSDPNSGASRTLAGSLCGLGFVVLALDLRDAHQNIDLIPWGLTPAGLMQKQIHAVLNYLLSRADVDPERVGAVGDSITTTIAVALNPRITASVIVDGLPDMARVVETMADSATAGTADWCYLIPGLIRFGSTEDLVAAIAPRPMLAFNSGTALRDYASSLYQSFGNPERIQDHTDAVAGAETGRIGSWMCRWLRKNTGCAESARTWQPPVPVQIPVGEEPHGSGDAGKRVDAGVLESYLGPPLPEASMTFGLKVARRQTITLATQPDFEVPVTVLRPGPDGADAENGELVAIAREGRGTLENDELVGDALRHGWIVWAVDPRGIGELASEKEETVFALSLLMGENFTWRQASDIRRIAELLHDRSSTHRVRLYGRGEDGALAAAYAAAAVGADVVEWTFLRDVPASYSDLAARRATLCPFDVLSAFDVRDVLAAAKGRVTVLRDGDDTSRIEW